jgi:uncharacterized membrane protein HdeD (DUF308 family)
MRFTPEAISFVVLGALSIAFGLWARGRVDELLDDDPLSDEEHEYRSDVMNRGAVTTLVVGAILIITGVTLSFMRY